MDFTHQQLEKYAENAVFEYERQKDIEEQEEQHKKEQEVAEFHLEQFKEFYELKMGDRKTQFAEYVDNFIDSSYYWSLPSHKDYINSATCHFFRIPKNSEDSFTTKIAVDYYCFDVDYDKNIIVTGGIAEEFKNVVKEYGVTNNLGNFYVEFSELFSKCCSGEISKFEFAKGSSPEDEEDVMVKPAYTFT